MTAAPSPSARPPCRWHQITGTPTGEGAPTGRRAVLCRPSSPEARRLTGSSIVGWIDAVALEEAVCTLRPRDRIAFDAFQMPCTTASALLESCGQPGCRCGEYSRRLAVAAAHRPCARVRTEPCAAPAEKIVRSNPRDRPCRAIPPALVLEMAVRTRPDGMSNRSAEAMTVSNRSARSAKKRLGSLP